MLDAKKEGAMSQRTVPNGSSTRFIAWAKAYELIVLIYSGAVGETDEQVRIQALDLIFGLGADDGYKDALRATLMIERQEPFFASLQAE